MVRPLFIFFSLIFINSAIIPVDNKATSSIVFSEKYPFDYPILNNNPKLQKVIYEPNYKVGQEIEVKLNTIAFENIKGTLGNKGTYNDTQLLKVQKVNAQGDILIGKTWLDRFGKPFPDQPKMLLYPIINIPPINAYKNSLTIGKAIEKKESVYNINTKGLFGPYTHKKIIYNHKYKYLGTTQYLNNNCAVILHELNIDVYIMESSKSDKVEKFVNYDQIRTKSLYLMYYSLDTKLPVFIKYAKYVTLEKESRNSSLTDVYPIKSQQFYKIFY